MHVKQATINGSSNIGLYGYVNDHVAILSHTASDSVRDDIESVLDVPIISLTVAGTNLVGAFITGNNDTVIIPDILEDHEREQLKDAPIDVETVHTTYTCLGNNVLVSDNAAVLSPVFSDEEAEHVASTLDVSYDQRSLAGIETVGALGVFNDAASKFIISNDVSEDEFAFLNDHFESDGTPTSVNMGAAQLRCGVLCNQNGFLVGSASGGPEITRIDEGLGYL